MLKALRSCCLTVQRMRTLWCRRARAMAHKTPGRCRSRSITVFPLYISCEEVLYRVGARYEPLLGLAHLIRGAYQRSSPPPRGQRESARIMLLSR